MFPTPIVEWAVWSLLDNYKDRELILLKGHLLIEIVLSGALERTNTVSRAVISEMSFYRKLTALDKAIPEKSRHLRLAETYLRELNLLRNQLAHEPFFDRNNEALDTWSEKLLQDLPFSKVQRITPRTQLTQAFAALAGLLHSLNSSDGHSASLLSSESSPRLAE